MLDNYFPRVKLLKLEMTKPKSLSSKASLLTSLNIKKTRNNAANKQIKNNKKAKTVTEEAASQRTTRRPRVTVKSALPEFQHVDFKKISVETEATWGTFLASLNVIVDGSKYMIKTSKSRNLLTDKIAKTLEFYSKTCRFVNATIVHLVDPTTFKQTEEESADVISSDDCDLDTNQLNNPTDDDLMEESEDEETCNNPVDTSQLDIETVDDESELSSSDEEIEEENASNSVTLHPNVIEVGHAEFDFSRPAIPTKRVWNHEHIHNNHQVPHFSGSSNITITNHILPVCSRSDTPGSLPLNLTSTNSSPSLHMEPVSKPSAEAPVNLMSTPARMREAVQDYRENFRFGRPNRIAPPFETSNDSMISTEDYNPEEYDGEQLKDQIIDEFRRIPLQDLLKMKEELITLQVENRRYSWSRHAPMTSCAVISAFRL